MLAACTQSYAFLKQSNWRWRKDDGSETTATWLADTNTAITISSSIEPLRLRIQAYSPLTTSTNIEDTLRWALSPATPDDDWINITTEPGTNPFVIAGGSANITDGEATTLQLPKGFDYPFVPGKMVVTNYVLYATLPKKNLSEYEWVLKPTDNILPNTTYYIRTWGAISEVQTGKTFPSIKTTGVLPVSLAAFTVQQNGKAVSINWTTAFEQNCSHFDVERSADAKTWKVIASAKGSGTSGGSKKYSAADNSPLIGNNFYRLVQYDADGKATIYAAKSVKLLFTKPLDAAVYPNPATKDIHIVLHSESETIITATLTDMNGRMIHHQTWKASPAFADYTMSLQSKPAKGNYLLHLKSTDGETTIKIMIE